MDDKQRELDEAQAKFDAAMKEKQELLDDAESCRRKMTAATQLIEGAFNVLLKQSITLSTCLIEVG